MFSGTFTRVIVRALDRVSAPFRRQASDAEAAHLRTGRLGEEEAYFYLRQQGYTVVARNWRTSRRKGELDMVAWHSGTLCFIEVKTRTAKGIVPAELAVDREKQRELAGMAKAFLRNYAVGTPYRFDVVSVYILPGEPVSVQLFKDAFGWRTMKFTGPFGR